MILNDRDLHTLLPELIEEPDYSLVNPASVDIRIGRKIMREQHHHSWNVGAKFYEEPIEVGFPHLLDPGAFALIETFENIRVPNGYAVELKLKSSMARAGWNHSLAFWIDPGWRGILTMEVQNVLNHHRLQFSLGMRFAQLIVHQLTGPADKPYAGRYQGAAGVEASKV